MVQKKLYLAFVWHMHQPVYQESINDYFLMPWVRLHAVKDYMCMLSCMDNYEKLKLNFSIVPILLTALESYAQRGLHDLHSKLTVTPVSELNDDDKLFIINNFFNANYTNMILPHKRYADLYHKRYSSDEIGIEDFSDEEYSDIMTWFNLVWFSPDTQRENPVVQSLFNKGQGYTDEDRVKIIEIQRDIIREIIPAYKKKLEQNRIEILATPYYHPILPILLDKKYTGTDLQEDAVANIQKGLAKYKEVFDYTPKGIWPPEQCISPQTLELLADMGFNWTITDEGILAKTINKEFVRDFRGYLEDPYDVTAAYKYTNKNNKDISILFRESVIPNLINFEYPQYNSVEAANDLYERIKTMQDKLRQSPDRHNLLTIALDGENCWESYSDDGEYFIKTLYDLIEKDESLETVLVSDYLSTIRHKRLLKTIHTGSWINRNLKLWIDEPTKNLAWQYVVKAKQDLAEFSKDSDEETINKAKTELNIAEGSDWFWWYGEPNDSGQDEIFDYIFRSHLINFYNLFKKPVPKYLNVPLIAFIGKPLRSPKANITPILNGTIAQSKKDKDNWKNAGCIEIPDGPILKSDKPFDKIFFGCDKDNLYLRFDMNRIYTDSDYTSAMDYLKHFQTYIYIKNDRLVHTNSANVRAVVKSDSLYPTMIERYTHEVMVLFMSNKIVPITVSKANSEGVWTLKMNHNVKHAFVDILELSIPFDDIDVKSGDRLDFCIVSGALGIAGDFYPKDILLSVVRP